MKKIELWTFTTCPFCVKARRLLDKLNIDYVEHVIPSGDSRLQELEAKSGCGTLPQLFVDGEFIGDNSKMYDLYRKGLLLDILN